MKSPSLLRALLCAAIALAPACGGDSGSNVSFGGVQDIGQFREVLDKGGIPGESTLDANGFFNEHNVPLPPAACGQDLCLHGLLAVHRDWIWSDFQAVLQVNLSSPIDASTLARPPLSLVAVIDTSSSMKEDEKLERVREGLHLLIDGLLPGDRLGIVSYGTEVKALADVQSDPDKAALHAAADSLAAAGSTNFYGGLSAGLEMSAKAYNGQRQNRVIMLSDGVPTRGITDSTDILEMADVYLSKGISVTAVGVGFEYDGALMKALAERGAGSFYYIEDAAAVKEIFAEELSYFLTPIALDLDIDVLAGSSYEIGEVVGAKGWTVEKSAGHIHVPAVFLSSRTDGGDGSPGDTPGRRGGGSALFLSMIPKAGGTPVESRVGQVTMKYKSVASGEVLEQSVDAVSPFPAGVAGEEPFFSHETMAKSYAMYNMFLGLRSASRSGYCRLDCSRWSLSRLIDVAELWNLQRDDADIAADVALASKFGGNIDTIMDGYGWSYPGPPADKPTCAPCRDGGCCSSDDVCSLEGGTKGTREPAGWSAWLLAALPLGIAARAAARRRRAR